MPDSFEPLFADHIDRVRRHTAPFRAGLITREVPGGWLSARPGFPVGDYPSSSLFRVYWLTQRSKLMSDQIGAAVATFRDLQCAKFYAWLAPWAWDDAVEAALNAAGARHVDWIQYIAFAREAGGGFELRPTHFTTRRIEATKAESFIAQIAPWYGEDGAATGARMIAQGVEEVFGAFLNDKPVGVGLLTMDQSGPGWGYLGAAGTDPAFRGQGAQTALIGARIRRVAELGAKWCTVETNTAVDVSLRNLLRCGFVPRISWRVYEWNLA